MELNNYVNKNNNNYFNDLKDIQIKIIDLSIIYIYLQLLLLEFNIIYIL